MIATMLVENYGCDVNPVDLNGRSAASSFSSSWSQSLSGMMPLHCASLAGNLPFVQYATLFCEKSASLYFALNFRYLVSKNANVFAVDNFGFSPLHHASFSNAADVCL
jgi:ankyrin repeat protein